jgi:hypothetical protein
MRHADFFLGVIVGIGAALLFARCPGSTGAVGKREGGRTIPFSQDRQYGRTGTEG